MALVGSYVGLSKLLVAAFPVFLLAWLRFGIAARRDAALGAPRRRRSAAVAPRPRAAVLGKLPRQLPVLDLHAVRRGGHLGAGRRRGDGGHPRRGGAAVAGLPGRAHPRRVVRRPSPAPSRGIALLALVAARATPARTRRRGGATRCCSARCVCEASYVVIGKRLTGQLSPRRISALINLWGLALVTPFGVWQAWHFDFARRAAADLDAAAVLRHWPPACDACGCGCRACAMCRRRGRRLHA